VSQRLAQRGPAAPVARPIGTLLTTADETERALDTLQDVVGYDVTLWRVFDDSTLTPLGILAPSRSRSRTMAVGRQGAG